MNPPASNEPIKVLFVEDNPGDVRLVQEILKEASSNQFDLTSVELVTEAVAELTDNSMDVILLDLTLPDAAGLETISRMHNAALNLPIVVLTGHTNETLALQALSEGAQDYLLKHNLNGDLLTRVLRYAVERKRADQMQRENEERFHALVQHSTDIITILAADGRVMYESPSLETIMGYKPEAVEGLSMTGFIHPDDLPSMLDGMTVLVDDPATTFFCEGRVRHADGSWRTLEMTMTNLLEHPAIYGIVVNSRDVTERRRSEEAIRFQAQLLNTVGQAVIASNLDNKIIYWNRFAETLYGWSAAEAIGRNIAELIPAEAARQQAVAVMTRLRAGESWQGEFTMQHKDGTAFPVLVTDTPILDEKGTLIGIIGVSLDISERKRSEGVLRESEARFKAITESLPVAVAITQVSSGTIMYANDLFSDLIGVPHDTTVGLLASSFYNTPEDRVSFVQEISQIGFVKGRELQIKRADGHARWTFVSMLPLMFDGEAAVLLGLQDITDIKDLEKEQAFLAAIVESSEDAMIGKTLEGVILTWNQGAQSMYGYTPDEAIGQPIQMLAPPERPDEIPALLKQLKQGEHIPPFETMRVTKAGAQIEVSLAISPIRMRNGSIVGAATVTHDITKRKQAGRVLQQYNRRLGVLHEIDRGILTAQSPQKIAERVAESLIELTHCGAVRIIAFDSNGKTLPYLAAYPPASQTSQELLWRVIENSGLPESFRRGEALLIDDTQTHEHLWPGFEEVLTAQGARSWIVAPLIAGEQLVGILAVGSLQPLAFTSEHVDVVHEVADQLAIALHKNRLDEQIQEHTHRLEARVSERTKQLHSAKERIETILMSASDAMIVANLDGSIQQVNTAFTVLFGYTLEQGRAVSLYALLDPASGATVRRISAELADGGQTQRVELVGLRQDGTLFDADAAFASVVDGLPTILICSIRDITERKQVEEAVHESEARYRLLADNIMDMVTRVDPAGIYVYLSPSTRTLLGYEAQELIGRSSFELIHPDDIDPLIHRKSATFDPNVTMSPSTYRMRHKAGHYIWVETRGQVIWSGDKTELLGFITVSRDITERRLAQEALQKAFEKEKDLNVLKTGFVSMVSHDFRSPLASIQSSSDLLQNYSERMTSEKKQHHFATINGQIKHLTGLLEDMLTVTQADSVGLPFHPVLTDLSVFCQTIADEMQALAGTRQIRFSINRPGELVEVDPDLLRRVLVNLLSNAVKYSPEGGVAEFSVLIGDKSLEIGVKDQGIGIPEADQAHLFEVFHRARNVGTIAGTGLGLAIVKRAVDAHGGTITVQSDVGVGTSFTISLPLRQAEAATP